MDKIRRIAECATPYIRPSTMIGSSNHQATGRLITCNNCNDTIKRPMLATSPRGAQKLERPPTAVQKSWAALPPETQISFVFPILGTPNIASFLFFHSENVPPCFLYQRWKKVTLDCFRLKPAMLKSAY